MSEAQNFLDNIENKLDNLVESADADDLFISGYLRGHIMLAAGYLEVENKMTIKAIIEATDESLRQAIDAGELVDNDIQLVNKLWRTLIQSS